MSSFAEPRQLTAAEMRKVAFVDLLRAKHDKDGNGRGVFVLRGRDGRVIAYADLADLGGNDPTKAIEGYVGKEMVGRFRGITVEIPDHELTSRRRTVEAMSGIAWILPPTKKRFVRRYVGDGYFYEAVRP